MRVKQKQETKEMLTYKIHIKPCYPFTGHEGKGEIIELTTDRLKWSMQEYQRNRAPFLYEVRSSKKPK